MAALPPRTTPGLVHPANLPGLGIPAMRSAAFNAIMYAPGGLPRSDREVVTTIVSRINR